jgi:hypothetical protein
MIALALALSTLAGAPADTVAFHFAWPEGLSASVEYRRSRSRAGQKPAELTLRSRLGTERRGDELRVAFTGWTGPGALDPLVEAGGSLVTVVSPGGKFIRVDGMKPALEALHEKLASTPGATPEMVGRIEKMAPALLTKDVSETWSLLVQVWNGQSFDVGERYENDSEVPVPALSGEKVRIHGEFEVARRLPCPGGKGSCVEARMRSVPDPEDVARIVKRFIGELGLPAEQANQMLGDMSAVNEAVLVTDPARLVPYRLEKSSTTTVRPGAGAGKDAKPLTGKDTTVYVFTYGKAAAPSR